MADTLMQRWQAIAASRAAMVAQRLQHGADAKARAALNAVRARRSAAATAHYRVLTVIAPPGSSTCGGQIRRILAEVAAKHGVSDIDILSARRHRKVVWARQEVMYRAASETPASVPQIARVMARDHTTVLHGIEVHRRRFGLSQPSYAFGDET